MTTRSASVLFDALAVLCPFAAVMAGFFDPPGGNTLCGLYILLPMGITLLLMTLLSLIGFVFGLITYRRSARSVSHRIEAVIVSIPFLLMLALIIFSAVGMLLA